MRFTIMLAVVLLSVPVAGLAQSDSLLCITGQTTTGTQGTQPQPPPFATCFSCDTTTTGDCDDYRSDPDAWDLEERVPCTGSPSFSMCSWIRPASATSRIP